MKTLKIISLIAIPVIFLSFNSWAGDGTSIVDKPSEAGHGSPHILLSGQLADRQDAVIGEVEKKNGIEVFTHEIDGVQYNKDGTISSVKYDDGTTANYKYDFGSDGKITECSISAGDVTVVIKEGEKSSGPDQDQPVGLIVEVYDNSAHAIEPGRTNGKPDTTKPAPAVKGEPAKPIAVYHLKGDATIEDIAKKPIKFDIKDVEGAISKAAMLKSSAAKEYVDMTKEYYLKMEKELVKMGAIPGNADGVSELERRRRVDDAVEEINRQAQKKAPTKEYSELLAAERTLRGKFVTQAEEIYDDKVKKAQKYINDMIDNLIASRIAVYMNVKKDKMDVLINLQNGKK